MPRAIQLSLFIREYFQDHREANPNEVFTAYKNAIKQYNKERRRHTKWGSYMNMCWYFNVLERLGLIKFSREESQGEGGKIARRYYRAVNSRIDDPAWEHPQRSMYPEHHE